MTAAARHAIRALAHVKSSPVDVLAAANDVLLAGDYDERFVTVKLAFLQQSGRGAQVRLGGAGHPGPAVVRADGRGQVMDGGGLPLGLFGDRQRNRARTAVQWATIFFYPKVTRRATRRSGSSDHLADCSPPTADPAQPCAPSGLVTRFRAATRDTTSRSSR
jgi:hypothetical protein